MITQLMKMHPIQESNKYFSVSLELKFLIILTFGFVTELKATTQKLQQKLKNRPTSKLRTTKRNRASSNRSRLPISRRKIRNKQTKRAAVKTKMAKTVRVKTSGKETTSERGRTLKWTRNRGNERQRNRND